MTVSRFFIERPVFANVLAIVTILIGALCLMRLPVSLYPNVVPPTVQVTASYPGASATTVARTVALPIEQQVNGVQGMLYMQSYSTDSGAYTLTVTFRIGTNLDEAQVLVQNRVASALASLPSSVQAQGVTVQKRSTSVLEFVSLTSPDRSRDSLYLSNYATIHLVDELTRIPGVGNVTVFGASQYAMRVWFDPNLLQARGLTAADVLQAVQQQSQDVPTGQLGAPPAPSREPFQYTLNVPGRLSDPAEFGAMIVKTGTGAGGQITRLRDVARVELGAKSYAQDFRLNGQPGIAIGIYQDPTANAMSVATAVKARMAQLSRNFPSGVGYRIPFDTTKFVSASINEVYMTLLEAAALVLLVILVFLQDWRAMMIPATTVPVTIVGAFAAMAALGFGVNISTLFAIVLAIGIVVDDAIVVVEGCSHWMERALPAKEAAEKAMAQLLGPIVGITLVLMSVFTPAAFLPGLTGQMYAQFALVIAATALISAINAVTLKPTQCATWLRPPVHEARRNAFYRGFNGAYAALEQRYRQLVSGIVRRSGLFVGIALLLIAMAIWGLSRIPTGFLPLEDQGYFVIAVQLPDGASLDRTNTAMRHVSALLEKVPGVDQVITISGLSPLDNSAQLANAGVGYVILKDWSQRKRGQDLKGLFKALSGALAPLQEARARVVPPPAIQGIGNSGGFTMQVELRDSTLDWTRLQNVTEAVAEAAGTQSGLQRLNTTFRASVPQYEIVVDRVKAQTLQVSIQDVFTALSYALGSGYAGQFDRFDHTFQVYIQADGNLRTSAQQIAAIRVRNSQGTMVPLGSVVTVKPTTGPSLVSLYNLYPSASIIGSAANGFSSGQAIQLMEQTAERTLPRGTGYEWTAMSYQEKAIGSQFYAVFGLALVLVYLVLAAQYESWLMPVSVLLAVPLTLVGAVAVLGALGIDNNLYTQIGLVLLVALSAKNAILIVELARELRLAGRSIPEAAVEAAVARFRPILMTSVAFTLGVLPLVLAAGAGANARKSIGITTLTGMISSTCLAVVLVPAFFVVIRNLEERRQPRQEPARLAEAPMPTDALQQRQ
jgi:hydrophobic/amphiphilic exporter-1 (mainly G- bacteria), HAE1 family